METVCKLSSFPKQFPSLYVTWSVQSCPPLDYAHLQGSFQVGHDPQSCCEHDSEPCLALTSACYKCMGEGFLTGAYYALGSFRAVQRNQNRSDGKLYLVQSRLHIIIMFLNVLPNKGGGFLV